MGTLCRLAVQEGFFDMRNKSYLAYILYVRARHHKLIEVRIRAMRCMAELFSAFCNMQADANQGRCELNYDRVNERYDWAGQLEFNDHPYILTLKTMDEIREHQQEV